MEKVTYYIPHFIFFLIFLVLLPQLSDTIRYYKIQNTPIENIVNIRSVSVPDITTEDTMQTGTIDRTVYKNTEAVLLRELNLYQSSGTVEYVCAVRKEIVFQVDKSLQTFPINYANNGCGQLESGNYFWQFEYRFLLDEGVEKSQSIQTNVFRVTEP